MTEDDGTLNYYSRHFTISEDTPDSPVYNHYNTANSRYLEQLVRYMMSDMEPTDRAIRPYGDIYPANGKPQGRPGCRGEITAMPGSDPWDGETLPERLPRVPGVPWLGGMGSRG